MKEQRPQRVVSLLGASTETIYRLGLEDILVGRSHECDYPPACLKLPCISRPRLDPEAMNSKEIDTAVRDMAAMNEPVYKLEDETLIALRPDLMIAQDHCRVCAITAKDMAENAACHNIPQLILRPSTLDDCLQDVQKVASALGYPERGQQLYQTLKSRLNRVKTLAEERLRLEQPNIYKPKVALLEWCNPIMGCGYWLPELVEVAGGEPIFSSPPGGATPTISNMTNLIEDGNPDVVILALCGFSITRTVQEIQTAWSEDEIRLLRNHCPVFIGDGNYLFNRSGPRVVESAEVLLEALHPSFRGHFGHMGSPFLMRLENAVELPEPTGATNIPTSSDRSKNMGNGDKSQENVQQKPSDPPSEMVSRQLAYLRANSVAKAFALNSSANQTRWCAPDRFGQVLKSHDDFKRLLLEAPERIADHPSSTGVVYVTLKGGLVLVWTCVVEKDGDAEGGKRILSWRTEKVGFQ